MNVVKAGELLDWMCVMSLVLYICNIIECKDMLLQ